jgi:hypothetical protein
MMVKRKPVKLFGKHFPEVEIELRRKIMICFPGACLKMARYSPAIITAPNPKPTAPRTRFPRSNQRQSPNHKCQIWPLMHDLWGLLYLSNSKRRSDVF